jgi:hypothetical protein
MPVPQTLMTWRESFDLRNVLLSGTTLVFVQSNDEKQALRKLCMGARVTMMQYTDPKDIESNVELCKRMNVPGVMVCVMPACAHGFRVDIDNLVWIGRVPLVGESKFPNYIQAVNRGTPGSTKLHHFNLLWGDN